ncbi:MAG: hypothetical protein ACLP2P_12130 [Desulfobaccales bacterium]
MDNDDIIKSFVINKLGCNCPAEVFNIIKWQKDVRINDSIILNFKINIGNRLLIYIVDIEDITFLNKIFLKIINLGIEERNKNNFNRFRFVIISDNIAEIGFIAQNAFNNLNIGDKKLHLHVMQKTDIALLV